MSGRSNRSSIFATTAEQYGAAWASMEVFGRVVAEAGRGAVVTEIDMLGQFEAAPAEQQQYLRTHPDGYNAIAPNGLVYSLPSTPAHQRRAKRTHR